MTDLDEIRSTIQNYFDGLYHGDIEKMQRAFHPCCHLYSGMEGGIQDESAPDWFRRIQNRASPASEGALRRDRIVFIDLNGSGSALVRRARSLPVVPPGTAIKCARNAAAFPQCVSATNSVPRSAQ